MIVAALRQSAPAVWYPCRSRLGFAPTPIRLKNRLEPLPMFRPAFLLVCFLTLVFAASVPSPASAHGGHAHQAEIGVGTAADAAATSSARDEAKSVSPSLQSYSQPDHQPLTDNDCHCPACHGCCHAPALTEAPAQFAPRSLLSHARPAEDGWLTRRWRSSIENPPKTFA